MKLFETMQLNHGHIPRLNYHTRRLCHSCSQLGFQFSENAWYSYIENLKQNYNDHLYRLKIEIDKDGQFTHVIQPLSSKDNFTARFKKSNSDYPQKFIINKTTERAYLTHNHETDLILLYDDSGKILEFDIGNIMIKENGNYYTPRYNKDFLRGCMRESLLENHKLKVKDYTKDELMIKLENEEVEVYLLNSLREVAQVSIYI